MNLSYSILGTGGEVEVGFCISTKLPQRARFYLFFYFIFLFDMEKYEDFAGAQRSVCNKKMNRGCFIMVIELSGVQFGLKSYA